MATNVNQNQPNAHVHPIMAAALSPLSRPVLPVVVREAEPKHHTRQVTSPGDVEAAAILAIRDMVHQVKSPWVKIRKITLHVMPESYATVEHHERVTRPLMVEATADVTMRIRGTGNAGGTGGAGR